jgi:Zn-dependent protease/predicted transcriptional regulator
MHQNIRLGKIAGIPIGANWSMIIILYLVTWELAVLILPADHPHETRAVYWIVAVITAVLFFTSLLAHEVSHAVIAKRNGIGVRGITFWLFGGVSELESEALTPKADFRIAIVGPATSFALAGVYGAAGFLLHQISAGSDVVVVALGWLAWMNVLLGGFNLIPGAPLDGGRVLRAALWRRSGNRDHAAISAAHAGRVVAYVLIGVGTLEFLSVGVGGLWFVFLGWFLLSAAHAEESSVVMRSSLANVQVRDVMTPNPMTFDASTSVADFVDNQLHLYRFGSFPLVGADGKLLGLTTMGRIREVRADIRSDTRLIDIAAPLSDVPVSAPEEPIPELLQRMQTAPDGRAFVIDETGRLVGIVSPSDIARYVQLCMMRSQGRSMRRN